jgi:hypothetical protein
VAWVVVVSGCTVPSEMTGGERRDTGQGEIELVLDALPAQPITADLVVSGTATNSLDLAIVQVDVQGRPATAVLPGYATWTATLTHEDLLAWSAEADGAVQLCAKARGVAPEWSEPVCGSVVVAAAP